jgi:hypothetical protein
VDRRRFALEMRYSDHVDPTGAVIAGLNTRPGDPRLASWQRKAWMAATSTAMMIQVEPDMR